MAIATNGQVAEEFFLTHGHAGVLATLAHQAGEVGVMQRRLGLGPGGWALLVNIGCGHKAPFLNSVGSCGGSTAAIASRLAPTFDRVSLWELAC
ncbi:hypothetical protein D3C86_1894650 [compost metagenome]